MSDLMDSAYEPMLNEKKFMSAFEEVAHKKACASVNYLLINGILAGIFISLAGYAYLTIKAFGGSPLLSGVGFCGLVMVVVLQAELFTSNTLLAVAAFGKKVSWGQVFRNWGIVYTANFIGSLFMAWLLFAAGADETLTYTAHKVADMKTNRTLLEFLSRGFLCNFLVVMGYQLAMFAKDLTGKVYGILFPVTLFVMCGFEHCIANMF